MKKTKEQEYYIEKSLEMSRDVACLLTKYLIDEKLGETGSFHLLLTASISGCLHFLGKEVTVSMIEKVKKAAIDAYKEMGKE